MCYIQIKKSTIEEMVDGDQRKNLWFHKSSEQKENSNKLPNPKSDRKHTK